MLKRGIRILIDSLMIMFLLVLVALPAGTAGWIKLKPETNQSSEVLPASTYQPIEQYQQTQPQIIEETTPETEEYTLLEE